MINHPFLGHPPFMEPPFFSPPFPSFNSFLGRSWNGPDRRRVEAERVFQSSSGVKVTPTASPVISPSQSQWEMFLCFCVFCLVSFVGAGGIFYGLRGAASTSEGGALIDSGSIMHRISIWLIKRCVMNTSCFYRFPKRRPFGFGPHRFGLRDLCIVD